MIRHSRLGNRLRSARAELRLSQDDLANRAGVTRQTVSSIENEVYVPSTELSFVLAKVLGCAVTDLFYLRDEGEGNNDG